MNWSASNFTVEDVKCKILSSCISKGENKHYFQGSVFFYF